ncbi:unnamed protein product [Cercospora beticola]|nr:unnamed protein product [Cercospora beticola]
MQLFLTWIFKRAVPMARAARVIEFRTLGQYRDSLMFWASYYASLEGDRTLPRAKLFQKLTLQMRYAHSKYKGPTPKKDKTWLGLAEIRQLLDHEATANRCIELSEQHQVLWCIARLTALRPGSLCPGGPLSRVQALTWKNFRFFRGDEKDEFHCQMTVDHINIKRPEDPESRLEREITTFPLTLRFSSPRPENIVFSPAHRLLVISIRHGILEDIDTLEDLFEGKQHEIMVKLGKQQDIVFYRGIAKGTALDKSKPLTSNALTEYLKRRGRQLGYTKDISMYSIRRRVAMDMVKRADMEIARFLLGHAPDSHTLPVTRSYGPSRRRWGAK